tara:strand:+ start:499 stop:1470 length:972 start_codon:yes stop_codon:yes gene_type:complete
MLNTNTSSNVFSLFGPNDNRPFSTPHNVEVREPIIVEPVKSVIIETFEPVESVVDCKYKGFKTFDIAEKELFTIDNDTQAITKIPKKKGLFVAEKCINIVADRYQVVQPNKVVEIFQNTTGLTVDKILTNQNTGGLLLKSTLSNPFLNGDEHRIDLTFYTGHNGQYKTFLSLQALRLACMNQLPALSKERGLWLMNEKHYQAFSFEKLQGIIETLPLQIANFTNQYNQLSDIKITKKDFLELFVEQYKVLNTKAGEKTMKNISDVYSFATGQDTIVNDSAYKAYQAITYQNTHNGRNTANKVERDNITNMIDSQKWFGNLLSA